MNSGQKKNELKKVKQFKIIDELTPNDLFTGQKLSWKSTH